MTAWIESWFTPTLVMVVGSVAALAFIVWGSCSIIVFVARDRRDH